MTTNHSIPTGLYVVVLVLGCDGDDDDDDGGVVGDVAAAVGVSTNDHDVGAW